MSHTRPSGIGFAFATPGVAHAPCAFTSEMAGLPRRFLIAGGGGRTLRVLSVAAILLLTGIAPASATDISWTGATSTAWATTSNWSTGAKPGSGDNAVFNGTFSNQPDLASNQALGGIWMTGAVGQNVTITGTNILSLTGNTINGNAGLGILIDNNNSFTLTINPTLKVVNDQTWRNNSGNLFTLAGPVNTNGRALTIDGSGDTTVSGVASGSGSITKSGSGTLTLSGVNSYSGLTTISTGVLNIQNASALGTTAAGTSVTSGAALQIQGGITVGSEALTLNGSGISNYGALRNISGNNSIAGAITLGSASTVYSSAGTLTLSGGITNGGFAVTFGGSGNITESGVISGTGALIKNDSGTLNLTGVNTFSGGSTLNGGTVIVYGSSLGASTGAATINSATLEIAATVTSARNFTLGSAASTVMVDPTLIFTANGVFSGTGALNKTGTGTLVLGGANTYTGATNINAGTLREGTANVITDTSAVTVATGATYDLNSFSETIGSLAGGGTVTSGAAGALTLTAGGDNTSTLFSGVLQDGSAAISFTKAGTGTLTLTGANTYSGATTISGGILTADSISGNALGSTSSITVNSGGTLLLGGTNDQINNAATVTLAGGTLNKGNGSEGTASSVGLGALTLTASGSHIDFGTGTVGVLTFASFTPGAYTFIIDNWTGTVATQGSGSTDRLIFNADQSLNLNSFNFTGYSGAIEFDLGGGFYEVVPAAVPEPATYISGFLALAVVVFHHRKQIRALFRRRIATK